MKTTHTLHIGDARQLTAIPDRSVQLIVTSPPYPMIQMWDLAFSELVPELGELLAAGRGTAAFELMHTVLDGVWAECRRVLTPGGLACINVGDATRSLGDEFALYPNHARVVSSMMRLGMTPLPDILWRKPTNTPNKFMGSGMLPAGAYVTYEHEYILIFRNGGKRRFTEEERQNRSASAYFWEERNLWFSDVWSDLRGTGQRLGRDGLRERSAAFPFELPYRLINMYALLGDTVLDPFVGTGTTMAAAFAAGRSSIGVDRSAELSPVIGDSLQAAVALGQARVTERLAAHHRFIADRAAAGKAAKHRSGVYGFPVMTGQEERLTLFAPQTLRPLGVTRWAGESAPLPSAAGAPPSGPDVTEGA